MSRSFSVLVCVVFAAGAAGCAKINTEVPSLDASMKDVSTQEVESEAGMDVPPEVTTIEVAGKDDGPKFSADSVGTTVDMNCGAMTHTATKLPPDILIVQDRSLSMLNDQNDQPCAGASGYDAKCGTMSKWSQVTTALNAVLSSTDTSVNWGMLYFGDEATQCGETATPVVPVAAMSSNAISQALVGQPVLTGQPGTPTRTAIINAVKYMKTLTDTNPKYLMLATDGQPNCAPAGTGGTGAGGRSGSGGAGGRTGAGVPPGGGTNSALNTDDSVGSEQAVADALKAGFSTFVIGIGNTGGTAVLNAMAVAGGKPVPGMPGGNSYYQVNNTADLVSALGQILGTVATCVFDIGPPPNDMTSVDQIVVFGDGTMIDHDSSNGWDFSNGAKTQVTLYGQVCDKVKSATIKDVTVTFGCLGPK